MDWSESAEKYVQSLKPQRVNQISAQRIFHLIDLTSLNDNDTQASIAALCEKATNAIGHVAGVCVAPPFARLVADEFADTAIKSITVANFPSGENSLDQVLIGINSALEDGIKEIDLVLPYKRYLADERRYVQTFVSSCKAACGEDVLLKVILETGALADPTIIAEACSDVFLAGADFVKTSTGKIKEGATLSAVAVMLLVIRSLQMQLKRPLGCKVSGGIRTLDQALQYLTLVEQIMGENWISPATFRIGASQLVDEVNHYIGS